MLAMEPNERTRNGVNDKTTKAAPSGRRHPIQQVDWAFVETILGEDTIASRALLTGGACNTNYLLTTSSGNQLVFRLYSRGSPQKDDQAMRLVKNELPVPQIFEMDNNWALMQFVPGKALSPNSPALWDVGRRLGVLSKVQLPRMGEIKPDGTIAPFPFGGFLGFFDQELTNSKTLEWITEPLRSQLRQFIGEKADVYRNLDRQNSLVHGDFNPGNILVNDERVVGILDWEFAMSGSPMIDAGNLLRHLGSNARHELAAGMASSGIHLDRDWVEKSQMADLASHLEFLGSNHSNNFKATCVERIRRLVSPRKGKS